MQMRLLNSFENPKTASESAYADSGRGRLLSAHIFTPTN
jgi:hypothetical protein